MGAAVVGMGVARRQQQYRTTGVARLSYGLVQNTFTLTIKLSINAKARNIPWKASYRK